MKKANVLPAMCSYLLVALLIASAANGRQVDQEAREILDATGVKGGFVVHIGCGDGRLTAALHTNDSYMVHGLDKDVKNLEEARKHIFSLDLYGQVSVDQQRGKQLPYIDNLINLVVAEDLGEVPMSEVARVLVPGGVAYVKQAGTWQKTVKPRPGEIDEWTHYLYDATGNAVSHDTVVGPPRRMQWVGSPKWARSHEHSASLNALVAANGRIFYIMDEGPRDSIQLPPKWFLTARDAFNGTGSLEASVAAVVQPSVPAQERPDAINAPAGGGQG